MSPSLPGGPPLPAALRPGAPSGGLLGDAANRPGGWIVLTVVAVLCSWFLNFLAGGQWVVAGLPLDPRALWGLAGLLVGFFSPLALVLRGRYPMAVTLACAGVVLVLPTSALPAAVALSALLARRGGGMVWASVAIVYAASTWGVLKELYAPTSLLLALGGDARGGVPDGSALPLWTPVIAAVLLLPFVLVGVVRRAISDRDSASRRSQQFAHSAEVLHDRVARDRERQAAAREIHDTLASRLSALSLNAGALELASDDEHSESARAARAVRESAQASLDDLRHVVQVLRGPAGLTDAGKSIADLRELIAEAHAAGDPVRASVMVDAPTDCPPDVAHAAYRVVQESLSNARRHAPGASVLVDVYGGPTQGLHVRVTNEPVRTARHPASRGTGHGVLGMRERVLLVGGDFRAGPSDRGGYEVVVSIPWK